MTDTTLSPASPSIDLHGRGASPVHKLRSAELARVWNERVEKIKKMRDEYESLRQRRLRQLLDAERAAQDLRDKLVEQRKQKREEAKRREDERRSAAEERRRLYEAEEKNKLEESIRRSTERESRFDSLKRRVGGVGHSEKYAFGSSLPRDFGSLFGSASASASRAESDYEDNGGSLKTSRSASPRRDPSKKERRAQSAGTNGRRVYETLPLSLAPDSDSPILLSAGGRSKLKGSSVMSTSMLVEYHSALMHVGSSADSSLVTSSRGALGELSASSNCRRARSHNAASASVSPRRVTQLDSSVSPLRSRGRTSGPSPVRAVNRCDDQLFISLPAPSKTDDRPARSLARVIHTSNGETALSDAGGFERHSSPRASRLRKPQVGRSGSPCKAAPSVVIPPRSSNRSLKQPTSPSRIPVSTRIKLERSHSAGAADSRQSQKTVTRNVLSGVSGIPKSVRPRSADPERRNRLPVDDTKPPATATAPGTINASSYAEWKAKMASATPSAMKDSILTPKRAASPSKLPQSLRPKTPTTTNEQPQQPSVVVRGRTKSPIKVSMTGSPLPQGISTQSTTASVGGSAAAIISIIKTPPITQPSTITQLPPAANASVQAVAVAISETVHTPAITATRQPPPITEKTELPECGKREMETAPTTALPPPASASVSIPSTAVVTDPAPSEAAPNGPLPTDANAGGWSQLEQALLAKRSEQLEEEWQKLKSDEERKQRELTDRERALKAREAQLAELEKERLARKERLKNIMTRVRPGAEEEVPPADTNRAQSMCTLTDLRSQQLGLFGGASGAGPSTSSVLDSALQRESARSATNAIAPPSCAEVEFAGAWAPSRRVMFAQAPLVLGGAPQQPPTAPLTIPRTAHNSAALNSILRTSRQSGTLQPGTAELSSSAPPSVGGLSAFGGISSLMQLRRQVEAAAASAVRAGQNVQPSGPSAAGSST